MPALGFAVQRDDAGNVIGTIGAASRPRILLLGHMDTVPPAAPARREGNVLHGRGAVDAKGPLAALIAAAAAAGPALPAQLVVAAAVEEETAESAGAHHLAETQPAPDAVVVGEPTGADGVCLGYKGRVGIEYAVERPRMHTSSPSDRAVEVAADFWADVREHLGPARGFDDPQAALTALDGDIEQATARITCRVPPGFDVDELERYLRSRARGGTVRLDERTPAVRRDRDDPVVRALVGAIRSHGLTPRPKLKWGTSDMNVVAERWDVPMAAYGPGDASLDHADDERIEVDELLRGARVLETALPLLVESLAAAPTGRLAAPASGAG
jgi:LysW-gamma-L-lysine carboxypeptidase